MRLLLDTHIAIWAVTDSPRLSAKARSLILDPANEISVSIVSAWELAIKESLSGKRRVLPFGVARFLEYFEAAGFLMLGLLPAHVVAVSRLPPLHGDPFDRMLVAQAQTEPMGLLTADPVMAGYGEAVVTV